MFTRLIAGPVLHSGETVLDQQLCSLNQTVLTHSGRVKIAYAISVRSMNTKYLAPSLNLNDIMTLTN
jgi:hypothetical protein